MKTSRSALSVEATRWILAAAIVVIGHLVFAQHVLRKSHETPEASDLGGAMVVTLADVAVANAKTADVDDGPERSQGALSVTANSSLADTDNKQMDATALKPQSVPPSPSDATLPEPIPRAETATASTAASAGDIASSAPQFRTDTTAEVAAAPAMAKALHVDPRAVAKWHGQISAQLERNKRYPREARAARQQGVVEVTFSLDRTGRIMSSRVSKPSGVAILDQEALHLLQRAQPFPILQDAIVGDEIVLAVPIRFSMR